MESGAGTSGAGAFGNGARADRRRTAVMGSGSFGTAIAKVLADAGDDVTLWARRHDLAQAINTTHTNPDYLPGAPLPIALTADSDEVAVLRDSDLVVCAVPAQSLRANLTRWRDQIAPDATFISLAKGVEVQSLQRMSEVIADVTGATPERIAVLSGPNFAKEVAAAMPSAAVIASVSEQTATTLQERISTPYFRFYTDTDVVGCEIGGAVKNVIALACGMAVGLGLGDNSLAAIMTRGLAETTRLAVALGAEQATVAGLAGVGDMVLTCGSSKSRNRSFGERLAAGRTLDEAQQDSHGQVAEGVKSCISVRDLASRAGVEMPITEAVYQVCHQGVSVPDAVIALLSRSQKPEKY